MLFLVGGPSQLDTWDMKPEAPVEIRGPYKTDQDQKRSRHRESAKTFPRMATRMPIKYAIISAQLLPTRPPPFTTPDIR